MTAKQRWELGAALASTAVLAACIGPVLYQRALDSALVSAMEKQDRMTVRVLLRRGAGVNVTGNMPVTPLLFVLRHDGDPELVKMLLDRGADVNGRGYGVTPLIQASTEDIRCELLRRGADVNAQDGSGNTALMYAAWSGDEAGVKTLLKHGADPNIRNTRGWTALTQMLGLPRIIRLLKSAGGTR